jgi:hypothetical protein
MQNNLTAITFAACSVVGVANRKVTVSPIA